MPVGVRKSLSVVVASLCVLLGTLLCTSVPAFAVEAHIYGSSFGEPGSGAGQLSNPDGVAVNDSTSLVNPDAGDVYVVDRGNNRVERFSSTGAYLGQFNGSGTFEVEGKLETGAAAPTGELYSPQWVAVDNSTNPMDPSTGDVYVTDVGNNAIDKFSANGAYLGQITTGSGNAAFSGLLGVAVDPTNGRLWVYEGISREVDGEIDSYSDEQPNKFIASHTSGAVGVAEPGFAVDSEEDLYVAHEPFRFVAKLNSTGEALGLDGKTGEEGEELGGEGRGNTSGIAFDPSNDSLYLDEVTGYEQEHTRGIETFTADGSHIETFGYEQLSDGGGAGLATNASTGAVYVADHDADAVKVFPEVILPEVLTGEPSNMQSEGSATLNGTIDPGGAALTECKFEYVRAATFNEPYANEIQAFGFPRPAFTLPFILTFAGEETVELPKEASPSEVQVALEALPSIGPGDILVTEPESNQYEIEFTGSLAHTKVPALTISVNEITVAIVAVGGDGGWHSATSIPCAQGLGEGPGEIGSGSEPVAVSASVSGLTPETLYHYRLIASNANGSREGTVQYFRAPVRPTIADESSSTIGATSATLDAQIDPGGAPTTYRVEYGTSESYGSSTPEESLAAGLEATGVQVQLSGLQADTLYHFRFVAANAVETVQGADTTFTTAVSTGASASALPDNRAYELASSPLANADVYAPFGTNEFDSTGRLVRAAADGEAVVYQAGPPYASEGGNGDVGGLGGNAYIATRSAHGWTQTDLQTFDGADYQGFSNDLTVGVYHTGNTNPGTPNEVPPATPAAPANCNQNNNIPFSRTSSDGDYHALFSTLPTQAPTYCGGEFAGGNDGTATIPQYSHLLYMSFSALTPEAKELSPAANQNNLYDSTGGQLYLISVLPDGQPDNDGAAFAGTFGKESTYFQSINGSPEDISADGSRVFWTDPTTEVTPENPAGQTRLFVREDDTQPQSPIENGKCIIATDACTVQVDASQGGSSVDGGGGEFWSANSEGSKVFFTDEDRLTADSTAESGQPDLYMYEVNSATGKLGKLTDLTVDENGHANVQGLVGMSEDGEYVYFIAQGILANNENSDKEKASTDSDNLYLRHDGATKYLVMLSGGDNEVLRGPGEETGDWRGSSINRTAEVTPDGHGLVFESTQKLTSYDNQGVREVYLYDVGTQRVVCASCAPSGASPTGEAHLQLSTSSDFMLRSISENGGRVFFDSNDRLVPRDVNGLENVYEWERPASGSESDNSCSRSSSSFSEVNGGCVYLLSAGTGSEGAYFLDASASGNDVFFRSRDGLAPQADNENTALYDARVGGGFPEASTECTGSGCQGVPPAPPIFATPSSVTFNGVGNFPPSPAPVEVKPKSLTTTQKLAAALKVCRKDKSRKKRASCEKDAHRRYGAAKTAKKVSNGKGAK
jgi:hypothetical protein